MLWTILVFNGEAVKVAKEEFLLNNFFWEEAYVDFFNFLTVELIVFKRFSDFCMSFYFFSNSFFICLAASSAFYFSSMS